MALKRPSNSTSMSMEVEGVEALLLTLSLLEKKVATQVLAAAVTKALAPYRSAARRRAPMATGLLKIAIANVVRRYKKGGMNTIVVGVSGPRRNVGGKRASAIRAAGHENREPANYAHLVEFGTKAHTILPGPTKKAITVNGQPKAVADVHGVKARPFMRPAWDSVKGGMYRKLADEVWKGIEKAAKTGRSAAASRLVSKVGRHAA